MIETWNSLLERLRSLLDTFSWAAARGAVEAVRYQPRRLDLVLACGASQPEMPPAVAHWIAEARARPGVVQATTLPHQTVRAVAARAAQWFGPTASALVRWAAGAAAAALDRSGTLGIERSLRARVHPGLLVPHPHSIVVLALDMRGFTQLTRTLHDTQYLADLLGEYLSEMTAIVERHRGVVFQYTGDGLLAIFLPELAGTESRALLARVAGEVGAELHGAFDAMHARWRDEWQLRGRPVAPIGLGIGVSYGRATIGFLGPVGKKHFGVIGEPVNLAAFLCSQAQAGTLLVDRDSFERAGGIEPVGKAVRLRSKKRHQRIAAICLRYDDVTRGRWRRLPGVS